MTTKKLTPEDVTHLAKLSALSLTPEEITLYTKQFAETLTYVENMQELDTAAISSSAHMSGQQNVYFEDGTQNARSLSPAEATANSKKHGDGYFIVDRIL